ncbi:hypothetical protein CRYUN_Cryun25bG0038700 [Craigia yunnanensis]
MVFFPSHNKQGYLNIGVKQVDTVTLVAVGITLRAMYGHQIKHRDRLKDFILARDCFPFCCFGMQWLCNADKSSHEPRLRLKAFFGSLYRCLARGARAVLQVYPENLAQCELILSYAMRAGFAGGVVVDYPHSTKKRKEYLVLTCGPPSLSTAVPCGKGEDGKSCSDDESSGDEENQTGYTGLHFRQAKTQEKAENKQERQGQRMGLEEEGTDEKKGKCCAPRHKVHSSKTEGSLLMATILYLKRSLRGEVL